MAVLEVLVGLAMLSLGRKLFWLFVSGVGFVSGALLAAVALQNQPVWVALLVALAAGLLGALLAVVIQRWAVGIAAFLAGGYVALGMADLWFPELAIQRWLLYIGGGVLFSVLVGFLFDWALIVLSSLSGALVVVQSVELGFAPAAVLLVALMTAGILTQANMMRKEKPGRRPR